MIKNVTRIQILECEWVKPFGDVDTLINAGKCYSYYDCYSFDMVNSNTDDFLIRFTPRFILFNAGKVIFEGFIIIEYHIKFTTLEEFKESIAMMGQDSNDKFKENFIQKEQLTELGRQQLVFDERVMKGIAGTQVYPTYFLHQR
jgi:hypothetical protein